MLNVGLTHAQHQDFHNLSVSHHRREIVTYLMDNNESILGTISNRLVDGQVDMDFDAEVRRKLSMTVYDPRYELGLDNANVNMGALFADRIINCVYQVWDPTRSYGYGVPVFRGPVTKVNRIGNFLSLEGSGKEYFLYSSSNWKRYARKGQYRHDLIRNLLIDSGEAYNNYYVPNSRYKFAKDLAISESDPLWPVILGQAKAMGRNAIYDADGNCIVLGKSTQSVYTYRKFCSEPEINWNYDSLVNSVIVIGAKPKGKKEKIVRRFVAPASHPMNPYNIGRTGQDGKKKGRFYTQIIEDSGLTTIAEVYAVGRKALADGLLQAVEASFTAPVIADMAELDTYTMVHEGVSTSAAYKKATIPLTGPPISTVGYLRKINPNRAVIRRSK